MEFNNKLYELRKGRGLSQEELASRLNVSRQTVSKWEVGDSTPDMERLIAISDLFDISLDELIKGTRSESGADGKSGESRFSAVNVIVEKISTPENKKRVGLGLKIIGIILAAMLAIDAISFIIYVAINGLPK